MHATDKLAMVASTVSSKLIESMAHAEGFTFVECLTGFKYIGNTILDLERDGYNVLFGYEEALGYMIGDSEGVRDKDGVSSSAYFAELAVHLHARRNGMRVSEWLGELYDKLRFFPFALFLVGVLIGIGCVVRYGYFQTDNSYFRCEEPKTVEARLDLLQRWSQQS